MSCRLGDYFLDVLKNLRIAISGIGGRKVTPRELRKRAQIRHFRKNDRSEKA